MRIFFLIFLLAYVGGNVYIFIRTLQMLSGFSLAMKILLSVVYRLIKGDINLIDLRMTVVIITVQKQTASRSQRIIETVIQ